MVERRNGDVMLAASEGGLCFSFVSRVWRRRDEAVCEAFRRPFTDCRSFSLFGLFLCQHTNGDAVDVRWVDEIEAMELDDCPCWQQAWRLVLGDGFSWRWTVHLHWTGRFGWKRSSCLSSGSGYCFVHYGTL